MWQFHVRCQCDKYIVNSSHDGSLIMVPLVGDKFMLWDDDGGGHDSEDGGSHDDDNERMFELFSDLDIINTSTFCVIRGSYGIPLATHCYA